MVEERAADRGEAAADPASALLDRMEERSSQLAELIARVYRDEIPGYRRRRGIDAASLRESIRTNLMILIACARERRGRLQDHEGRLVADLASQRLDQGLAVQDLQRAYIVGARVTWAAFLEEIERENLSGAERSEVLSRASAAVFGSLADCMRIISETYADAAARLARAEERAARTLVDELFGDAVPSTTAIEALAAAASFRLHDGGCVVVLRPQHPGNPEREWNKALALADRLHREAAAPVVGVRKKMAVGILTDCGHPALRTFCTATDGWMVFGGLGRRAGGVAGLRNSYRQALAALQVAQHLGQPRLLPYDEALPYVPVCEQPELAAEMVRDVLGPLFEQPAWPSLLKTLETYLACQGSGQRAAASLHVHRQTLYYRLGRIEQLVGRRLDQPSDRLALELALLAYRVAGPPPGVRSRPAARGRRR